MPELDVIHHGQYTIQRMAAQPFDYDKFPRLLGLSNVLAWVAWALYLIAQVLVIHNLEEVMGSTLWSCWAGLFAEFCISLNDLAHALHLIFRLLPQAKVQLPRPHYFLMDGPAPKIDVFITCCGEPTDIVMNTTVSVAGQDYQASQLRVIVCDDAHSEDLRIATEKLNSSKRFGDVQILYGARSDKGKDFKAGNLRFAIDHTLKLGGSEFFGCVDADMMADSQWLRRMVPHLLLDSKMGMVTQPQHYYNTPKNDPLSDQIEFDLWYTIFEPLNDRFGQAMCQGSGWLVRRSAIEDIGGWPIVLTGEDVMCSQTLLKRGWGMSFVREWLQHGRTADTLASRLEQKSRWAIDHIAFVKTFGWIPTTAMLGALTWREFTSITTTIGLILLPLTLLSATVGSSRINVTTEQYSTVNNLLLFAYLAAKLNDYFVYRHIGLTRLSKYQALETWSAPCESNKSRWSQDAAKALIKNILPNSALLDFSVTGAFKSQISERSKQTRASFGKRLLSPGARMCIIYVVCSSAMVLRCLNQSISTKMLANPRRLEVLILPGPILKMTACIWKMYVPVWYMAFPPDVPEWTDLLQDDERGILRPKREVDRIMTPAGSEEDNSFARVWFDALELSVLFCYLGQPFHLSL